MDSINKHQLYQDFIKTFPIEKLKEMTLEQYTNLDKSTSFCYWIETKTDKIGPIGGGSSYKFGIYKWKQKPKENSKIQYDNNYAWYKNLNRDNANDAFLIVKETIIKIAEYAINQQYEEIDKINIVFGDSLKWKIAFLYSKEQIIPIFKEEWLKLIYEKRSAQSAKNKSISDIQKYLIANRNGKDLYEYSKEIIEQINKDQIIKIQNINGIYDCDINISVSEWENILSKEDNKNYILWLKRFYNEPEHKSTCSDISKKYSCDAQTPNSIIVHFAKFVQNKLNRFKVIDFEGKSIYWIIPMMGKYLENGLFEWILREELVEAMENLELTNLEETKLEETIEQTINPSKYSEYIELLKANHNLIFTGAPGTGKTFLAKQIAKEMGAEYKFVQFHPSFDYTDFVEGLRPIKTNDNQNIGFERVDGTFKKFCNKAIISKNIENKLEINDSPTIWKVSLGGTYENQIREDCLKNGYIRIGWSEYGNADFINDEIDYKNGGKTILKSFSSEMKIGDIIVSCYSEKQTDAIGIVSGGYEYKEEGQDYPRYRNVNWLVKNIREDIVEINNNTKFTLSTVYKLKISIDKIFDIVNKYSKSQKIKEKPFVFIIDEINRGEISKIFGELFFAIDPGYRGKEGIVETQYQNLVSDDDIFKKGFYVPENVYIIGTMNDIDRSVESMDFAMRRRFAWKEIETNEFRDEMFSNFKDGKKEIAIFKMDNLNKKIKDLFGSEFEIGPVYFKKLSLYNYDFEKLWKLHISGILKEYLRGNEEATNKLEDLKNAYYQDNND